VGQLGQLVQIEPGPRERQVLERLKRRELFALAL
jgi:hypothetical protein